MTRIRQVAPLLHIINFNNLCFRVENETTLISAKNRVDLSSISEVRSYITEWPRFFWPPCIYLPKILHALFVSLVVILFPFRFLNFFHSLLFLNFTYQYLLHFSHFGSVKQF